MPMLHVWNLVLGIWVSANPVPADSSALLERARALYRGLDFAAVLPVTEQILAQSDVDPDQRVEAHLLHGSSLAVMGDLVGAERSFRVLLRARPDFDMPNETSPRILAVFRKVQFDERSVRQQIEEVERRRVMGQVSITEDEAIVGLGGAPLVFSYRVRDPHGVVADVSVRYRKKGEGAFSSLALKRKSDGVWTGNLTSEWTSSPAGFVLEHFVSALDGAGTLASIGTTESPRSTAVLPGVFEPAPPIYETVWFWGLAAATVAAIAAGSYVAFSASSATPSTELGDFPIE